MLAKTLGAQGLTLRPAQAAWLFLLSIGLPLAFSVLYKVLEPFVSAAWLAAAIIHTMLAIFVMVVYARRGVLAEFWSLTSVREGTPWWLTAGRAYWPSLFVLIGVLLLVAMSRRFGAATGESWEPVQYAWILWVPVVEECVFRAGIGATFQRLAPGIWGAWFAAVVFALVHTAPTLPRLLAGEVGLPLGPFLLGLACETLVRLTGRIVPAIALHAVCNATVVVFAWGDARWLTWLGFLYG